MNQDRGAPPVEGRCQCTILKKIPAFTGRRSGIHAGVLISVIKRKDSGSKMLVINIIMNKWNQSYPACKFGKKWYHKRRAAASAKHKPPRLGIGLSARAPPGRHRNDRHASVAQQRLRDAYTSPFSHRTVALVRCSVRYKKQASAEREDAWEIHS